MAEVKNNDKAPKDIAPDAATKVDATTVIKEVPAQVMGTPVDQSATVSVHETVVHTDRVITDANSPLAVQVPEASEIDLPIHALAGKSPEEVFASKA